MPARWRTQSISMQSLLVEACWRPMVGDVAGDFHDVIDLNDGRVVVVIGDVAGVGLQAAEKADDIKALLHRVFRRTDDPSDAFALLDAELERAGNEVYATVATAVVDPAARRVHLANAGHLPPLVTNGVEARLLEGAGGPPLGLRMSRRASWHSFAGEAALFFYTDGLVERRQSSLDDALDQLCEVGRGLRGTVASAAELARRAVGQLGQPADDATIVSVRFLSDGAPLGEREAPGVRPHVRLRVYLDSGDLRSIRIESIINELAMRTEETFDFTVEILDIARQGIDTERDGILAVPSVVRVSPPPIVRVVGGVSSVEELADALQLPLAETHPGETH